MCKNESKTWLDRFPTEIVHEIFDYLSPNDIFYTFFYFNERFNTLLLHPQCHLNYFELPSTDFQFWRTIIYTVSSKIETLIIFDPSIWISLNIFSNLTSIIIKSSSDWTYLQLELLFNRKHFQRLHTFKIIGPYSIETKFILTKVFHPENVLQIFHYQPMIHLRYQNNFRDLQTNFHLHSLILSLNHFKYIYQLIQYTPNLKYLNIQLTNIYSFNREYDLSNLMKIKLEKLYITLRKEEEETKTSDYVIFETDLAYLICFIRTFSQSLICLSLNFTNSDIDSLESVLIDGEKFKIQLLQYLEQLKDFHLNVKLSSYTTSRHSYKILSIFETSFYFDHHWYFGINSYYLYSLPYKYDELYEFDHMKCMKFSDRTLLQSKPSIWFKVKTIRLVRTEEVNIDDLIQSCKIHMPYLQTIKIRKYYRTDSISLHGGRNRLQLIERNSSKLKHKRLLHNADLSLNTVTCVHLTGGEIEDEIEYLFKVLPNLTHLILENTLLPPLNSSLISILQEKVQRLDVMFSIGPMEFIEMSYMYFSNVRYAQFTFNLTTNDSIIDIRSKLIGNCLKNLSKLINLKIYTINPKFFSYGDKAAFEPLVARLSQYDIDKNYKMIYIRNSLSFHKKTPVHDRSSISFFHDFLLTSLFIVLSSTIVYYMK
ncbi:hypothetical protein I4U23_020098 [Adineta vaga]|nr:hypothetical protein I4U23_020098 [Adineta vaga]